LGRRTAITREDTLPVKRVSSRTYLEAASAISSCPQPGRGAQFLTFRDLIEQMASNQLEQNSARPMRTFAKHIPRDKDK
jgi:hypothetical protein